MFSYKLGRVRTSSAGNPITFSYTVEAGDNVIVLLLKVNGATNRAGGSPTWGSDTFTQANSTQKAATSPEASAELWYLLNPTPGTQTLTIPNTGALTIFTTVAVGRCQGGRAEFDGANGGNATSTNPTPGAVTVTTPSNIGFAITAGGWTTWAPSSQAGTVIANTDDGATGGGEQYLANAGLGSHTLSWTFGTSDDWGAVAAFFREVSPVSFNNYMGMEAGSGISIGEKIR